MLTMSTMDAKEERDLIENELTYIGFTIIYDPPRPNVLKAVKQLDSAGIFPIMITFTIWLRAEL